MWRTSRRVFWAEKMSYANVLCQIKASFVGEMEGQGAWEGVAWDDAGGWPGTAHIGLHSEGNGNPWKNFKQGRDTIWYILYARLRGRVNTGSLLPRTVSVYSCHPCIIINNALFLSGKSLDIDEKFYSKFKQRGKPWRWGDWLDSCCRNPGEKWCGQEHRDAYESRLMG